jgi:hypothetical protein
MTCREFQLLFLSLAFDDLAAEPCRRAHTHVQHCPSCAHEWASYHRVIALARQLADAPLPVAVSERVRAALARRDRDEARKAQAK